MITLCDVTKARVDVQLPIARAFALWTDAGRFPQWQVAVLRVSDASGPIDAPGTTFRLDYGSGMRRTVTVARSRPGADAAMDASPVRTMS